MESFDYQPQTRVVFGAGAISRLGELSGELNFRRTLLVADRGLVDSGHVAEAVAPLRPESKSLSFTISMLILIRE